MAGMRALGRVYNIIPNASGLGINLRESSGIGLCAVCTSTSAQTLTFTAAKSYGGSYQAVTTANGFGQPGTWYQATAAGTAVWAAQTSSWASDALSFASTSNYVGYVDYLVSELADGYDYVKVTATAGLTLWAFLYDLVAQRTPANLVIPSA